MTFRDPSSFRAGELHNHYSVWQGLVPDDPSPQQVQVLNWIRARVSVFDYFQTFCGTFKGEQYHSARPPSRQFQNNAICNPVVSYIRQTLLHRLKTGAIKVLGEVGAVDPPHLVLPLTIEPNKPRLCYDARFLNLWMRDAPFSLDTLSDLPRYVSRDSYQTVLDDKSGYDHILLNESSWPYFGFEWVAGISTMSLCLLDGRYPHLCTIPPALFLPIIFDQSAYLVPCTLMIDIMANYRFHSNVVHIFLCPRLMISASLRPILLFFSLLIS